MNTLCTLFTTPKAFLGHNALIQHNALRNWKALSPEVSVILMGNDEGVAEAAHKYSFTHIPNIACTSFGTPLLDDMFSKAQLQATTPFIGYVNADIMFPSSLIKSIQHVSTQFTLFMMIGQRYNVDITEELDTEGKWTRNRWDKELEKLRRRSVLFSPWGIDYFIFPRGSLNDMLPFTVGRPGWDSWLVWSRQRNKMKLINTTSAIPILHQNHTYRHVPQGDGTSYAGPEADINALLIEKTSPNYNPAFASTFRANYKLINSRCSFDWSYARFLWYLIKLTEQSKLVFVKNLILKYVPRKLLLKCTPKSLGLH